MNKPIVRIIALYIIVFLLLEAIKDLLLEIESY